MIIGDRFLYIPTVIDRIIQQAIAQMLQGIYEPLFMDSSYGYRPKRSAQRLLESSRKLLERKLKLLTKRNQGRNVRKVMANVKQFIRGWIQYFYIADRKRTLQSWNEWLRRRFHMDIWKQWKKPKTKEDNLGKLGVFQRKTKGLRGHAPGIVLLFSLQRVRSIPLFNKKRHYLQLSEGCIGRSHFR